MLMSLRTGQFRYCGKRKIKRLVRVEAPQGAVDVEGGECADVGVDVRHQYTDR